MRRKCLVTGGTSQIASWLVPQLIERDWEPHLLSRGTRLPDYGPVARWSAFDLTDLSRDIPVDAADVLFHTARLDLLPPWVERLPACGVKRLIAFGTTSIFTKRDSVERAEREWIAAVVRAEEEIAAACRRAGIHYTIFRPTLIYGGRFGDRNISEVARIVGRLGVYPLSSGGKGLRQPVHAADLADACLEACDCAAAFYRAYDLTGGETLTYRAMIERVFQVMGRTPHFVRAPAWVFSLAIGLARLHPRLRYVNAEMVRRMARDMVFDCAAARRDFGYAPRPFTPSIGS